MDDQETTAPPERSSALARGGRPGAFAAAGLVAGGLLAGALTASAADSGSATPTAGHGYSAGGTDRSQPQRGDEQLLTGTTADKVEAAALAEYPGATVVRIESDSDGVYEAHLTTADGTPVTVEVDTSFTVTGTEQHRFGRGRHGDRDGDGPAAGTEPGTTTSGYAA